MYNYLNTIQTTLLPIEEYDWQQQHEWVYHEIGKRIKTDNVIDIGGDCGLLGAFLIYYNYCKHVDIYDYRETQTTYARALVETMGLTDRINVFTQYYTESPKLRNTTLVATRAMSLLEFETLVGNNTALTLRRTDEVEPYFIRESTKVWKGEIIRRSDGFELEVLTQ
jgi:hypothetical protein